jgi:hypothetical protein
MSTASASPATQAAPTTGTMASLSPKEPWPGSIAAIASPQPASACTQAGSSALPSPRTQGPAPA